jgi:hypothetical protein
MVSVAGGGLLAQAMRKKPAGPLTTLVAQQMEVGLPKFCQGAVRLVRIWIW